MAAGTGIVRDSFLEAITQICEYTLNDRGFAEALQSKNPQSFLYLVLDDDVQKKLAGPISIIGDKLTAVAKIIKPFAPEEDLRDKENWIRKVNECKTCFAPALQLLRQALREVRLKEGSLLTEEQQEQFLAVLQIFIDPEVHFGKGSDRVKRFAKKMLEENNFEPDMEVLAHSPAPSVMTRGPLSPRTAAIIAAHEDSPLSLGSPMGALPVPPPPSPRENKSAQRWCYALLVGSTGAVGGAFTARAKAATESEAAWTGAGAAIGFVALALFTVLALLLKERCSSTDKSALARARSTVRSESEWPVRGSSGPRQKVLEVFRHDRIVSPLHTAPKRKRGRVDGASETPVIVGNPFHASHTRGFRNERGRGRRAPAPS